MRKLIFILSSSFLLMPGVAFGQTESELSSDLTVDELGEWVELDATLGLTATGEAVASTKGISSNSGAGELSGALSLRLTDPGAEPCTLYCGPHWANGWGVRADVVARGLVGGDLASAADSSGLVDMHVEQSAEVALWSVSIGQTFSYQQDATFYRAFWRPHDNTMSAGITGGGALLSGRDENGQVEVMSVYADWRRLVGLSADTSADELSVELALVDGDVPPGESWFEGMGLGVVTVDFYGVFLRPAATEEAMSFVFDLGRVEGLRFWDAPWKLDVILGFSGMYPLAEVHTVTTTNPNNGELDVQYSSGPMVAAPHLWLAAHHMGEHDYRLMPSTIFESIPRDANFGVGVGSFHRLDGSAFAVDVGEQAAGYLRLPVTNDWSVRAEVLGIRATRVMVSELAVPLPIKADETFYMGRAEAGVDWSIADSWTLSANAWAERSDREDVTSGLRSQLGVRAGLYFTY